MSFIQITHQVFLGITRVSYPWQQQQQQHCLSLMQDQIAVVEHKFVEGWKLEALDRSLPSVIRPATVVRVINKLFFVVEFDDLTTSDEGGPPTNHLCCHAGSLNIFPVGWCSANSIHLSPVPG